MIMRLPLLMLLLLTTLSNGYLPIHTHNYELRLRLSCIESQWTHTSTWKFGQLGQLTFDDEVGRSSMRGDCGEWLVGWLVGGQSTKLTNEARRQMIIQNMYIRLRLIYVFMFIIIIIGCVCVWGEWKQSVTLDFDRWKVINIIEYIAYHLWE